MRALVVYESMFGNTKAIAEAVAEGLSGALDVELVPVEEAPGTVPGDVALLVVGGPTHAFSLSRANTRHSAAEAGITATSVEVGLREWLATLEPPASTVSVATFDTKLRRPPMPGSAARRARRVLRRRGLRPVAPATTFWVAGSPGPLLPGELDRARQWGTQVASGAAANVARA
jgi:hypothetical protein